jgi:ribosomal protein S6
LKTVAAKLYEGMFLVDSALAASDWQGVNDTIRSILERFGAEIVTTDKWDERKLAYDIKGKSRGTYILVYFRVNGERITEIERTFQINENIMRVLILCVDDLDEQYITKPGQKTAVRVEEPRQEAAPVAIEAPPVDLIEAEPGEAEADSGESEQGSEEEQAEQQ